MAKPGPKSPHSANWKPGQCGNPGGRPKGLGWLRELARNHTEEAINTLVECMGDDDGRVRVSAANAILDRGWGRPPQEITGANGTPLIPTNDELEAKLAAVLAGVVSADDASTEGEPH